MFGFGTGTPNWLVFWDSIGMKQLLGMNFPTGSMWVGSITVFKLVSETEPNNFFSHHLLKKQQFTLNGKTLPLLQKQNLPSVAAR